MKTPKEQRMEKTERNWWRSACIALCLMIALSTFLLPFTLTESANERTTREATAFMSTVQPGDTLYWFDKGRVRPLPIIRNIVADRVVIVCDDEWRLVKYDGVYHIDAQAIDDRAYSYNEVYQFIVKVVEHP